LFIPLFGDARFAVFLAVLFMAVLEAVAFFFAALFVAIASSITMYVIRPWKRTPRPSPWPVFAIS